MHNIEDRAEQARACWKIVRVLKPGGRAVIGDYVPAHGHARAFADAGLTVMQSKQAFGAALSLMWILVAEKPANTVLTSLQNTQAKRIASDTAFD